MKYVFSFIQIVNWLLTCKSSLQSLASESESLSKAELIAKLKLQKQKLLIVKDVLDRKTKLQGINSDFLRNLKEIKRAYGIEDQGN